MKGADDPVLAGARDPGGGRRAEHPHDDQRRAAQVPRERHASRQRRRGDRSIVEQRDFDLVVSDIKMPDKTGYDVFAAARQKSQTLPGDPDDRLRLRPQPLASSAPARKGLQAVLFKPFKVDQLLGRSPQGHPATAATCAGRAAFCIDLMI